MPSGPPAEPPSRAQATSEGHHVVVDGRRWRATDPSIPETLRAELVAELMAARRAVGAGNRSGDDVATAAARRRVQDAKVALGERGRPWWERVEAGPFEERVAATVRTLLAHRGHDRSICPSDVARAVGGGSWRDRMDDVRSVAQSLARAGVVRITKGDTELDPDQPIRGPVRIRLPEEG